MPCQVEEGRGWCHRRYDPCHVRGGAAVEEGGATWGGVTGGVTHAMSGGGGWGHMGWCR